MFYTFWRLCYIANSAGKKLLPVSLAWAGIISSPNQRGGKWRVGFGENKKRNGTKYTTVFIRPNERFWDPMRFRGIDLLSVCIRVCLHSLNNAQCKHTRDCGGALPLTICSVYAFFFCSAFVLCVFGERREGGAPRKNENRSLPLAWELSRVWGFF